MIEVRGKNVHSAILAAIKVLSFDAPPTSLQGAQTIFHDLRVVAESGEYDFDIGHRTGYNQAAFSRIFNLYTTHEDLAKFIFRCCALLKKNRAGAVGFVFKSKAERNRGGRGSSLIDWGNCLLGMSMRTVDRRKALPEIILTSRACYLGATGMLDAAIPYIVGKMINPEGGWRFIWDIHSARISWFKLMPYVWTSNTLNARLQEDADARTFEQGCSDIQSRTWRAIVRTEQRIRHHYSLHGSKMVEAENYGFMKRMKARWLYLFHNDQRFAPHSLGLRPSDLKFPAPKKIKPEVTIPCPH